MKKKASLLSIMLTLTACGGGDDNTGQTNDSVSATPSSLKGLAIDGYIQGATAFLDMNYNGEHDSDEPSAITGENGDFELSLNSSQQTCADYVPLVVNVPVGAIDSDSPNSPISEAFILTYPPSVVAKTDRTVRSTTPLTTVLWSEVKQQLQEHKIDSCEDMRNFVDTRPAVLQSLKDLQDTIAQRYNVSADQLFSDFVQDENAELYGLAQNFVQALKKSFDETTKLRADNPGAQIAQVEYWVDDLDLNSLSTNGWYRTETVLNDSGLTSTTHKVSSDLQTQLQLQGKVEYSQFSKNGLLYNRTARLGNFDESTKKYSCRLYETTSQEPLANSLTIFGIKNTNSGQSVDWESCAGTAIKNYPDNYRQHLFSQTYDSADERYILQETSFQYTTEKLDGWVNVKDDIQNKGRAELDSVANMISTSFEQDGTFDTTNIQSWTRIKYDYYQNREDGLLQRITTRNSHGQWTNELYYQNGTNSRTCSTDGNNWSSC